MREIRWWTCDPSQETLTCVSIREALEEHFDRNDAHPIPASIIVYGFASMELGSSYGFAANIVERLLEELDEEFGDPNGVCEQSREVQRVIETAAMDFIDKVKAVYKPWACEQVVEETVNPADYGFETESIT